MTGSRRSLTLGLFLLLVCCLPAALFAQNGTIAGRIVPPRPVSDLLNYGVYVPGTSYQAKVDQAGNFSFPAPAGTYRVVAEMPGCTGANAELGKAAMNGVVVRAGETTNLELRLVPQQPRISRISPSVIEPTTTAIEITGTDLTMPNCAPMVTVDGTLMVIGNRDLAVFTPTRLVANQDAVRRLMDEYRGRNIPDGSKSLVVVNGGVMSPGATVGVRRTAPTPPPAAPSPGGASLDQILAGSRAQLMGALQNGINLLDGAAARMQNAVEMANAGRPDAAGAAQGATQDALGRVASTGGAVAAVGVPNLSQGGGNPWQSVTNAMSGDPAGRARALNSAKADADNALRQAGGFLSQSAQTLSRADGSPQSLSQVRAIAQSNADMLRRTRDTLRAIAARI